MTQYPQYIRSTRYDDRDDRDDQLYASRGMSLVEAMVSLLLLSLILVAFLGVLDSTSKVAKVQGNIADSTENLRFSMAALVRIVRMAGTGGLPIVVPDSSGSFFALAIDVIDHTDPATPVNYGGKTRLAGTDVLLIRGVIVDDLHEFKGEQAIDFSTSTLTVPSQSPLIPKPESQLVGQLDEPESKPILIAMNTFFDVQTGVCGARHYGGYRVIETIASDSAIGDETAPDAEGNTYVPIQFTTDGVSAALNPGGVYHAPSEKVAYACGFIDEMWFFISENAMGEPSLYRFDGSGNAEELVSNIANLQIAVGCDIDCDGVVAGSEFFYSETTPGGPTIAQFNALREVRISLVARSMDPDRTWSDDTVIPENADQLSGDDLKFRHRVITVRTGLRSHPVLEGV